MEPAIVPAAVCGFVATICIGKQPFNCRPGCHCSEVGRPFVAQGHQHAFFLFPFLSSVVNNPQNPPRCYDIFSLPSFFVQTQTNTWSNNNRSFARFKCEEIVPIRPVGRGGDQHLYAAELWHGPSLAFKDLGISVLTQLLQHFLAGKGTTLNVLVGTSGDTVPSESFYCTSMSIRITDRAVVATIGLQGSSAIEAVKGLSNINLVVLFPEVSSYTFCSY